MQDIMQLHLEFVILLAFHVYLIPAALSLDDIPPGVNPAHYGTDRAPRKGDPDKGAAKQHTHPFYENYHHGKKDSEPEPLPVFDVESISNELPHIQEHLDVPIDTANMTEKELQFHYFKIADADKNNKLDGQELVYFIIHRQHEMAEQNKTDSQSDNRHHHHGSQQDEEDEENKNLPPDVRIFTDKELIDAIDPILSRADLNMDGLIDWQEFVTLIDESGTK